MKIIDSRKDLTQGVVDGTDESDGDFTWGAHFFWDKTGKQIHKLSYHGSHSHCDYYFFRTVIIKIIMGAEQFYRINDHFLDVSGTNADLKIKAKVSLGTDISNSIRKNLR